LAPSGFGRTMGARNSDPPPMSSPPVYAAEDRTLPIVVYVLYLVGLVNGLTILIGLAIAYANKDRAGPRMQSHYIFQIRSVWTALAWWIIGFFLLFWGGIFSFLLIGIPFAILGWLIVGAVHLWFGIRCIVGLVFVSQYEGYPRPRTWLV
jgi:uncharacterized membrane protein